MDGSLCSPSLSRRRLGQLAGVRSPPRRLALGCHFIREGTIAPSVLWVSNLCRLACGATSYRDFWHLALSFIWLILPSLGLWHESLEPGA